MGEASTETAVASSFKENGRTVQHRPVACFDQGWQWMASETSV